MMNSGNQKTDTQYQNTALLYGMQRTGTNYTRQLIEQNFSNIRFYNDEYARCLPVHKHFRLYSEKSVIPDAKYSNSFIYKDFHAFRKHVEQILNRQIRIFIVVIKNPYSWYVSYKRHARKNKYTYFRKQFNPHYIVDYNLFYRKWLDFSIEAPHEVMIVRYEDLMENLHSALDKIGDVFNLEKAADSYQNPEKVNMSKRFTQNRKLYYEEERYLNRIDPKEKNLIKNLIAKSLMSLLNY